MLICDDVSTRDVAKWQKMEGLIYSVSEEKKYEKFVRSIFTSYSFLYTAVHNQENWIFWVSNLRAWEVYF